jgi:predicted DNA-binding protein (UPF0251 family)
MKAESVIVPDEIRELVLRKMEEMPKRKLSKRIGISEPTLYRIADNQHVKVSPKTLHLLENNINLNNDDSNGIFKLILNSYLSDREKVESLRKLI